jgi:hypothetical protein
MLFEEIVFAFLGHEVELKVENFLLDLLIDGHGLNQAEKRGLFPLFFSRGIILKRMLAHKLFKGEGIGHVQKAIIVLFTNLVQLVAIGLGKLIQGPVGFIQVLKKLFSLFLLIHCFRGNLLLVSIYNFGLYLDGVNGVV